MSINEFKNLSLSFQGGLFLDAVKLGRSTYIAMILLCRIDEIHQQLEEQLSVLSHFIDGVANLRPKGSPLSLVFLLTFSTCYTLL